MPFSDASQVLEIRGTSTAVECAGSGPPLLLIHGAEGSRRAFDGLVPELTDAFRAIRYDQRDCGETVNDATEATLATLADDLAVLLDRLDIEKASIFGTSFGGRLAQTFALLHPTRIDRLMLASTWALQDSLISLNREAAAETARLRTLLPDSAEALSAYFFPPDFLAAYPAFRAHFKKAPPRDARAERRARTIRDVPDLDVGSIAVPTLLLAGELDRLVPPSLTLALGTRISGSRSAVLPGLGHITYVQAPQQVASRLLDFR